MYFVNLTHLLIFAVWHTGLKLLTVLAVTDLNNEQVHHSLTCIKSNILGLCVYCCIVTWMNICSMVSGSLLCWWGYLLRRRVNAQKTQLLVLGLYFIQSVQSLRLWKQEEIDYRHLLLASSFYEEQFLLGSLVSGCVHTTVTKKETKSKSQNWYILLELLFGKSQGYTSN